MAGDASTHGRLLGSAKHHRQEWKGEKEAGQKRGDGAEGEMGEKIADALVGRQRGWWIDFLVYRRTHYVHCDFDG